MQSCLSSILALFVCFLLCSSFVKSEGPTVNPKDDAVCNQHIASYLLHCYQCGTSEDNNHYSFPNEQPHAVFYRSNNGSLYVGGKEVLYQFDFDNTNKEIESKTDNDKRWCVTDCHNYITLIGQLEEKLLVCGTNAEKPACWYLDNGKLVKRSASNEEFSPPKPQTNFNILITGNEVYSTVIKPTNNGNRQKPRFRKILTSAPLLYTGDNFFRNPHFVKSMVINKEEKYQEKILLFFMEDNIVSHTTEKRVAMVAQMCKGESGPEDPNSYNMFSTALKSRIICGYPDAKQYFPNIQDVFLLKRKDGDLLYGLFTNAWNQSAVCSYNVSEIENVFSNPTLFESKKTEFTLTPGTCLIPEKRTPIDTFTEVSNHPEITAWVMPTHVKKHALFQTEFHYTNLVVDEVTVQNETRKVLYMARDNGSIYIVKELENGISGTVEIQGLELKPERIRYLELDPDLHMLYVGNSKEVARVSVDECSVYNKCQDCNEDPSCDWKAKSCKSKPRGNSHRLQRDLHPRSADRCPPLEETSQGTFVKYSQFMEGNGTSRLAVRWLLWVALLAFTVM